MMITKSLTSYAYARKFSKTFIIHTSLLEGEDMLLYVLLNVTGQSQCNVKNFQLKYLIPEWRMATFNQLCSGYNL